MTMTTYNSQTATVASLGPAQRALFYPAQQRWVDDAGDGYSPAFGMAPPVSGVAPSGAAVNDSQEI